VKQRRLFDAGEGRNEMAAFGLPFDGVLVAPTTIIDCAMMNLRNERAAFG